ncbi:MAG: TolC family protein [Pseudoxanthomonas sp.]|nr:TolC family protein [Pseudoxanthomonas sp.]
MRAALADSPMLDSRRSMEIAAAEDAGRADAFPDPRLTLAIDDLPVARRPAGSMGDAMPTTYRIGVMQDLPSARKRQARRQVALARAGGARLESEARRLAVARAAAVAWIERWQADRALELLVELEEESARVVELAGARLQSGQDTAAEALAAHAARVSLDNRLTEARATQAAAHAGLARWLGEAATARELPWPDFDRLPVGPRRLVERLEQQADLQAWAQRETEAAAALDLARFQRRPDWRVGISYGVRDAGFPDVLMLEVGIDLPVAPRNRQDRDVAARRHELEAVRAEREDARRSRRALLDQTLATWRSKREQAARYRDTLLPLARDRSAVTLAAYGGGASLQPWLEARSDEIEQRLAHLATVADQGRAWALLATLLDEGGSS